MEAVMRLGQALQLVDAEFYSMSSLMALRHTTRKVYA